MPWLDLSRGFAFFLQGYGKRRKVALIALDYLSLAPTVEKLSRLFRELRRPGRLFGGNSLGGQSTHSIVRTMPKQPSDCNQKRMNV